MNKDLRTIVVAPMTTTSRKYPTIIEVKHDNKADWIVIDQIGTIDKQRIIKVLWKYRNLKLKVKYNKMPHYA